MTGTKFRTRSLFHSVVRFPRRYLFLVLAGVSAVNGTAGTAETPAIRPDYPPEKRAQWLQRHEEFVAVAARGGMDVLFLGDSITDYWRDRGRAVWDSEFAPLHAANFGVSGDRTQQVLWRISNGEVTGISPRVVVLLIGTNNLDPGMGGEQSLTPRNSGPEIVAGVGAIITTLQSRIPDVRVLLLGLLPRDQPGSERRHQVKELNRSLAALESPGSVVFLDAGAGFLAPDGTIPVALMPDLLHPTEAGYRVLADAIKPTLVRLLASPP
jgi:lysophospholipase L1-like esterase